MRIFGLVLAYDGTDFSGWQVQPRRRTVQGVLEQALEEAVGPAVDVAAAGRTDAGVHARGQVVSFRSDTGLPSRALAPRLNRVLPADVRVRRGVEVPEGFHARFSATSRSYAYELLDEEDVLRGRFAWCPPRRRECARLEEATSVLIGEHDCSAFRTQGGSAGSPVCRITRAAWVPTGHGVRFEITANHFLYRMVRNVVGTALEAAMTADPASGVREVLASRDRGKAGTTAPPHALSLESVCYPEPWS